MNKTQLRFIILPLLISAYSTSAQQVGIHTDVLKWATTTPNMGIETVLNKKITLNLTGAYNPWQFGSKEENKKMQHWTVDGQLRFWPYEAWDGHFLAPSVSFTSYNAGGINIPFLPFDNLKNLRYEGYAMGAGFTYGYQWFLGPLWNLELSAGAGYYYLNYKKSECRKCGSFIGKQTKHWFGPTNIGVSFIYLFKSRK